MSYCRWGRESDLYCYEDVSGGHTTLTHDGQDFNDPTLEALRERILQLQAAGYKVATHLLEQLDEALLQVP